MPYEEVHPVDCKEIVRLWQKGLSQRRIASLSRLSRPTVARYLKAAATLGVSPAGPEPTQEQLAELARLNRPGPRRNQAPAREAIEPFAGQIEDWIKAEKLQLTRVHELIARRGLKVSYASLQRFCRERGLRPSGPRPALRMAPTAPGEVAEMDFVRQEKGIVDRDTGKERVVWLLSVVLACSRHMFVWPTVR